ncbi:MAG: peptide chain release factor N(5)-glutamine methyltransferase [Gammaproteobacteria bacterium]|nr:peptide chain release factor N(5)-glutamine methyltransferase [Gammaproteobacteria bacterium]HXK55760.1 peptide chain release factor N(5)-glutamine methyltransferase [Gammaproteobacteria bacterium]
MVETISQALRQAASRLSGPSLADTRLEAEILLAHVLDKPRTHLFAWPDARLDEDSRMRFERLVERRLRGEPSAYLTGRREFWSLELKVTADTLVPRPETELLVEQALDLIPVESTLQIVDLGTGCGAISAAIASERPACRVLATDSSAAALAVAVENFRRLGLDNISCRNGYWCNALPAGARFDMIVSNPPYVASDDPHLSADGLPWEPANALISGSDGLNDIREIVRTAREHLVPGGWLLLEHGYDQGKRILHMLRAAGYRDCSTVHDLGGMERVSRAQLPL